MTKIILKEVAKIVIVAGKSCCRSSASFTNFMRLMRGVILIMNQLCIMPIHNIIYNI